MPSKTLLEFVNKKKRRRGSESGSDVELQYGPGERPPSPIDDVDRRRSGRSTKRKKYVDEVEFNFSDDENLLLPNDTVAAPVVKSAAGNKAETDTETGLASA